MPRPSRNLDQALINAAITLLPHTGVRALSIRQVAEHAGANLGMFHYHFKTKDAFVRTVLQQMYDDMFADLTLEAHHSPSPVENLRGAITVLARFARDHRVLLARLIGDALAGETTSAAFLKANIPRHIGVVAVLIAQAQKAGALRKISSIKATAFIVSSVAAPIMLGTAALVSGLAPAALAKPFARDILSNAAIAERIDMALAGLAGAAPPSRKPPRMPAKKSGARK